MSEKTTAPPSSADERALEIARSIGEHDRKLRERGASHSGLFRALAIGEFAMFGLEPAE